MTHELRAYGEALGFDVDVLSMPRLDAGTRARVPARRSKLPVCLPASATACELAAAGRRPDQRDGAVLRTCQHRSGPPRPARAPRRTTVRVVRACGDELVGVLERRIEEQCGTGQVERAMDGAGYLPEVCGAPEHVFVWCVHGRTDQREHRREQPRGGLNIALQSGE